MKHATTREIFSYWSRLRAQRAAPERADIEPAAIRNVLADTFILEVNEERTCPIRVVGARINALFGRELKGEAFSALWREDDRATLQSLVAAVLDDTLPAIAGAIAAPRGRPNVELEMVLLPLRHYGRTHARVLGALSLAAIPSWLGLLPAAPMTMTSLRIVGAGGEQRFGDARPAASRESAEATWSAIREPVRRGHLLVHTGGR